MTQENAQPSLPQPTRPLLPPPAALPETETISPPSNSETSETAHIDELLLEVKGLSTAVAVEEQKSGFLADVSGGKYLSKETFTERFMGMFTVGRVVLKLKCLEFDETQILSGQAAAHAIYDTAEEVPALRFLIKPGNKWVERAIAIGMFTVPIAIGVWLEISARGSLLPKDKKTNKEEKKDAKNGENNNGVRPEGEREELPSEETYKIVGPSFSF